MSRVLEQAGLPAEVTDLIPEIVETCSICRSWTKPQPDTIASVAVASQFNIGVEADLLFYKEKIVLQLVDRCTRWHAAREVPDKTMETLITHIDEMWTAHHGPMKEFIMDGETAIAEGWVTKQYFEKKGIKVVIRAPGQHARFIERRGALLRDILHKVDDQLKAEGITGIPFPQRLSEAVFAGNALISVNRTTPYNAVYGRVPHILPDINSFEEDASGTLPGVIRHSHRLREIAVQQMVEGTARERINRAMRTRTKDPAQAEFSTGQPVDIYRPPNQKDLPGWFGPGTVTSLENAERGTITVEFKGRPMNCRPGDLRPHMGYLAFLAAPHPTNPHEQAFAIIRRHADHQAAGNMSTLGWVKTKQEWTRTPSTQGLANEWAACQYIAEVSMGLTNVTAARIGNATITVPACSEYAFSSIVVWTRDNPDSTYFHYTGPGQILNMRQSYGPDWNKTRWVQFLSCSDEEAHVAQREAETDRSRQRNDQPTLTQSAGLEEPTILSPIPEGTEESRSSTDGTIEMLLSNQQDKSWEPALRQALVYLAADTSSHRVVDSETVRSEEYNEGGGLYHDLCRHDIDAPDHCYHLRAANVRAGHHSAHCLSADPGFVELSYTGEARKLVHRSLLEREPEAGEIITMRIYHAHKKAVIERDTDLLTATEVAAHHEEVVSAMLSELKTWHKLGCFSRKKRKDADNIIDCKWVLKWKKELLPDGTTRRIIRARLTVRGFKDKY
jgi:hypothetical protein